VGFFQDRAKKGVFGVGTKIGHFFAPVFRDVEFYNFINFENFCNYEIARDPPVRHPPIEHHDR